MTAIIGPLRPYDNNLTFAITFLTVVDLGHLHMRKCHEYIDFNRDCASQGYREKTQTFVKVRLCYATNLVKIFALVNPIHCNPKITVIKSLKLNLAD